MREEKKHQKLVKKLNKLSRKNPGPFIRWLIDAEQIPEDDIEEDCLGVINLIKKCKQEIFNKLVKDKKSFELYNEIQKGFKRGDIIKNKAFQKTYKRFYRLGRNFGDKLSKRYFELLQRREGNIEKILIELSKIKGSNNKFSVWLAFASKLIHTIDNNQPIYDSRVAKILNIKSNYNIKGIDRRINDRLVTYDLLKKKFGEILANQEIKRIIHNFKKRLEVNINNVKMLDFILWKLGDMVIKTKKSKN
jgi:hypothetical protein